MPDYQQMIFVEFPSSDLARSRAYDAGLGLSFDELFCGPDGLMVRLSDAIHPMLLRHESFARQAPGSMAPPGTHSALHAISQPSPEDVDLLGERAIAQGGRATDREADGSVMVPRDVFDPDGNGLEAIWMDVEVATRARGTAA